MRGQMYLISAVLIAIFLATVFTYLNLSINYDIDYKHTVDFDLNWVVNSTNRIVFIVKPLSNSKLVILNFPYHYSKLTVFSNKPLSWQVYNGKIYIDDSLVAGQTKIYYVYLNGTTWNKPTNYVNDKYYFLTYYLNLPNLTTYGDDVLNFDCDSIDISGPVFVKFCNTFAFKDFIYTNDTFNLTANELYVDGTNEPCNNYTFSNKFLVFHNNYYIEIANFTGDLNCTSNKWIIQPSKRVYIEISPNYTYAYADFGDYNYNVSIETIDDYFSYILSKYSVPYRGYYTCYKNGGLINDFNDLHYDSNWINNSFIQWNTTALYYDGVNLQKGNIKINGNDPTFTMGNPVNATEGSCKIQFYFFNMSPVIHMHSNGLCKVKIPIGVGEVKYSVGKIEVINDSYKVYYIGNILSNSSFPNIYFYDDMYLIIARENYVEPFYFNFTSFCPRIV